MGWGNAGDAEDTEDAGDAGGGCWLVMPGMMPGMLSGHARLAGDLVMPACLFIV